MPDSPRSTWNTPPASRLMAVLLAFIAAAVVLGTAPSASAASGDPGRVISGTTQRDCPDTRCSSQRSFAAAAWVPVHCWRDAGVVGTSARWFRITAGGKVGWVHGSRMNIQPAVPYCSDMRGGEVLFSGQSVWSPNGSARLVMQSDGNLVQYNGGTAVWSTRSSGSGANRAAMQSDGHLVVYTATNAYPWRSGTAGNPGTFLAVQSDGNVVLYAGSTPLYATSWYRTIGTTRGSNVPDSTQCTWLAMHRFQQHYGVYPGLAGDAHAWDDSARTGGWQVHSQPMVHSILVREAGTTGASRWGHVEWVENVQLRSDGWWVYTNERNYDGLNIGSTRSTWKKHVGGWEYITGRQL